MSSIYINFPDVFDLNLKRKIESAKLMGEKLTQKLEKNEITSESLDNFL